MDHVEYAYTEGLDDRRIEDRLTDSATGVLALADAGEAYAIPLAHFYDGDSLYFRVGMTVDSRKQAFLESTTRATYVVYGTSPTEDPQGIDSWSILVSGPITSVPVEEHDRFDTAAINQRFAPIRMFDEAIEDIEIAILALDIESMTGRRTLGRPDAEETEQSLG
ncbi:MAG: pyridoxamine 5'-phosphate oxidase family protein [Halobacteriaceae archaeon]